SFVFLRTLEEGGCAARANASPGSERMLIVVNNSEKTKSIEVPMDGTALAGCTSFAPQAPAAAAAATIAAHQLRIDEPAESMSVFEVR
ncbi:MAG: hypothetical protein ABR957_18090, partial [Terracidiphilus sp.]